MFREEKISFVFSRKVINYVTTVVPKTCDVTFISTIDKDRA